MYVYGMHWSESDTLIFQSAKSQQIPLCLPPYTLKNFFDRTYVFEGCIGTRQCLHSCMDVWFNCFFFCVDAETRELCLSAQSDIPPACPASIDTRSCYNIDFSIPKLGTQIFQICHQGKSAELISAVCLWRTVLCI